MSFGLSATLDYVRHLASPPAGIVQLADDEADIVAQIKVLETQLNAKRQEAQALLQDVTPRQHASAVAAKEVARVAADEAAEVARVAALADVVVVP